MIETSFFVSSCLPGEGGAAIVFAYRHPVREVRPASPRPPLKPESRRFAWKAAVGHPPPGYGIEPLLCFEERTNF
jgi:hypothetical protein